MFLVGVMQMYIGVFLCNAMLVMEIFCINIQKLITVLKIIFSTKFGDRFSNLLGIKHTKFYSDLFMFDISIV